MKENAVESFIEGYNCSQAVLMSVAEKLGIDEKTASKIAAGFGGGASRTGNLCGAVSGAIMAMGMTQEPEAGDVTALKEKTYSKINPFLKQFEEKFGSLNCREILREDISTEEGRKIIAEQQLQVKICRECVRFASEYVKKEEQRE